MFGIDVGYFFIELGKFHEILIQLVIVYHFIYLLYPLIVHE